MDWIANMFSTSWGRTNMYRDRDGTGGTRTGGASEKWLSIDVLDNPANPKPPNQCDNPNDDNDNDYKCKSVDSVPLPAGDMDMLILPTVIPHSAHYHGERSSKDHSAAHQYQPPRSQPRPLHQP